MTDNEFGNVINLNIGPVVSENLLDASTPKTVQSAKPLSKEDIVRKTMEEIYSQGLRIVDQIEMAKIQSSRLMEGQFMTIPEENYSGSHSEECCDCSDESGQ